MNPYIIIEVKNVYGNKTVYPACEQAKKLAELAGTKTFTPSALRVLQELGYLFIIQPQSLEA